MNINYLLLNIFPMTHVNSCKKLILVIKNRVKMIERNRTEINLRAFKKVIHNQTLKELEGLIT